MRIVVWDLQILRRAEAALADSASLRVYHFGRAIVRKAMQMLALRYFSLYVRGAESRHRSLASWRAEQKLDVALVGPVNELLVHDSR